MYTIGDYMVYGNPHLRDFEGFGQAGVVGAIATGVATIAQVGATIYAASIQQRIAEQQMRQQRREFNAQEEERKRLLEATLRGAGTNPGGAEGVTEKPPGTSVLDTMGSSIGVSGSNLMLYGGLAAGAIVLLLVLRK